METDINKLFMDAYEKYADPIFRHIAFRVWDRELAKEMTQDVFMKTWDYLAKGKTIDEPRAFLYRVAHNAIVDAFRKRRESTSLDMLEDSGFDVSDGREGAQELFLDGEIAVAHLEKLSDGHREVLVMKFIDDMTISEIARLLEESENTVSVRIHRALKKMKDIIGNYEK